MWIEIWDEIGCKNFAFNTDNVMCITGTNHQTLINFTDKVSVIRLENEQFYSRLMAMVKSSSDDLDWHCEGVGHIEFITSDMG